MNYITACAGGMIYISFSHSVAMRRLSSKFSSVTIIGGPAFTIISEKGSGTTFRSQPPSRNDLLHTNLNGMTGTPVSRLMRSAPGFNT
ncbi:MAG: hypothetical protein JWO03_1855 [Bacteroidetes bacterium]|nr:hypothetical protein [Bacteroidota bacterium]